MAERLDLSRTEAWLRAHEEWPLAQDELRDKVLRVAGTAHVQSQAERKPASRVVLATCFVMFGLTTWVLSDFNRFWRTLQPSPLVVWSEGMLDHPVDSYTRALSNGMSPAQLTRTPHEWLLVQAQQLWVRRCQGWIYRWFSV